MTVPTVRPLNNGRRPATDNGDLGKRVAVFLVMVIVGIGFPYLFWRMSSGTAVAHEEELVESRERYTGQGLGGAARYDPPPAPETETPEPLPTPPPAPPPPPPAVEEPKKFDLELVRKRSSGPMAVVQAAKVMAPSGEGTTSAVPSLRHVPRGTVLTAFLESRVRSDILDSRVRAQLLDDFTLSGDVILPRGGYFIGNAASLGSRYQNRIAVTVTNYIYPDREREVRVNGLLLNPDESAHLLADDVDHHSGKLIAGIVGLEALRAVSGAIGGYDQGNRVAVSFGSGVGSTTSDVFEPSLEQLTQILPTITVEPGKPVLVFVEDSFDVPAFDDLPARYAAPAAAQEPSPSTGTGKDAQLDAALARLNQAMASAEQMQSMASGPREAP